MPETTSSVTDEVEPLRLSFRNAALAAIQTFSEQKSELSDLSPRFWVAWLNLNEAIYAWMSDQDVLQTMQESYKQFGAPGDFGYGTLCGDTLRALYDAWNAFSVAAHKAGSAES